MNPCAARRPVSVCDAGLRADARMFSDGRRPALGAGPPSKGGLAQRIMRPLERPHGNLRNVNSLEWNPVQSYFMEALIWRRSGVVV